MISALLAGLPQHRHPDLQGRGRPRDPPAALGAPNASGWAGWLEAIGKWSLTDVVVAAVLLAIFSLNAIKSADGGVTAVPRFALGFFICYCILAAFHFQPSSAVPPSSAAASAFPAAGSPSRPWRCSAWRWPGGVSALGPERHVEVPHPAERAVADAALIKLVRTNTELVEGKFTARSDRPAVLPFTVPFHGTIAVDRRDGPRQVRPRPSPFPSGAPRMSSAIRPAAARRPCRCRSFPVSGKAASYRHTGKIPPGKYDVIIRNEGSLQ